MRKERPAQNAPVTPHTYINTLFPCRNPPVTPHTYMDTLFPCPSLGVNSSFLRDSVLYRTTGADATSEVTDASRAAAVARQLPLKARRVAWGEEAASHGAAALGLHAPGRPTTPDHVRSGRRVARGAQPVAGALRGRT